MGPELEQHTREFEDTIAAKARLIARSTEGKTPRIPRQERPQVADQPATPTSAYDSSTRFLGEMSLLLDGPTS